MKNMLKPITSKCTVLAPACEKCGSNRVMRHEFTAWSNAERRFVEFSDLPWQPDECLECGSHDIDWSSK